MGAKPPVTASVPPGDGTPFTACGDQRSSWRAQRPKAVTFHDLRRTSAPAGGRGGHANRAAAECKYNAFLERVNPLCRLGIRGVGTLDRVRIFSHPSVGSRSAGRCSPRTKIPHADRVVTARPVAQLRGSACEGADHPEATSGAVRPPDVCAVRAHGRVPV